MAEIESEIKLTISRDDYHKLLEVGRVLGCREQLNVYLHDPLRLREGLGYFRVRFETGKDPVATLKIPVGWEGGVRRMVELEKPLHAMGPGLHPRPRRTVGVKEDLPGDLAEHFLGLGIRQLKRLGWMRNRRCVVALGDLGTIELDRTVLPHGSVHFEVEIESGEEEIRDALVTRVQEVASSARLSEIGKFSRFLNAVMPEEDGSA